MNQLAADLVNTIRIDSGLQALCAIAGYYRIPADPAALGSELALGELDADEDDLIRASARLGLKARLVHGVKPKRLASLPAPAIVRSVTGHFVIFGGRVPSGDYRLVDPITRIDRAMPLESLLQEIGTDVLLVARKFGGAGIDPSTFGWQWFLPSLWRYRGPLAQVILASLFIQLFALVTPLFFQVVVDKVLAHRSYATLLVLITGILGIGLFDVVLQFLRTYTLSHTTNRIDVELGQRLFHHLLRLPLSYFETRGAGLTVARMRELENIRQFITGQGLFSALDLLFTFVFIGVLFAYSTSLTFVVLATIPVYVIIAAVLRPGLKARINEKFTRCAESQQFLVETVVGMQTVKAAAVEPLVQHQWEEKLSRYVHTAFGATVINAVGGSAIQYVSKASSAVLLLFGAKAVMDGDMTIGGLIAFNMIAGQVAQPVLRLSQLWQDFQQVQTSVDRLGDIFNAPVEPSSPGLSNTPAPQGRVEFRSVSFRYRPNAPEVLKQVSFDVEAGEVIGIVGASGSGKSTLTKLIQRLYRPEEGRVLIDGQDLAQVDPRWLRRNIGVVLQDNMLFNRSIHDNIAFANPAMTRTQVMRVARLAGVDDFIGDLPAGYDSIVEERGANLSGGQRQRIAIARALALNPPILIFDEATSALDYESERVVQANMRHICQGRTVFIIAHRLAAVRGCDRIIGMRRGRVEEIGTHEKLLERANGVYAQLWALQNETARS